MPFSATGAGGPVGIGAVLQVGDDPDRRLVEVIGEIGDNRVLAQIALLGDAGRRFAVEVARPDHLVESLLVPALHGLLDLGILDHQEAPFLRVAAVGRADAGAQDLGDHLVGHRIRLQSPHRAAGFYGLEQIRHGVLLKVKAAIWPEE